MSEIIKCLACDADMGITAEKCMKCGTPNPKILEQKKSSQQKLIGIGLIVAIVAGIYFIVDYNSAYNKCLREGNKSGLLNKKFVESMCQLAKIK